MTTTTRESESNMHDSGQLLMDALSACAETMADDLQNLRPELLNESVFRHHLVKAFAALRPEASIQIEWKRIDLIVQVDEITHVIEIKYYGDYESRHLDGSGSWFKGGPGRKNFSEFVACLNKLRNLENQKGMQQLSSLQQVNKWLILAYSDRFARWYNTINLPDQEVASSCSIVNGPKFSSANGRSMKSKLIRVD